MDAVRQNFHMMHFTNQLINKYITNFTTYTTVSKIYMYGLLTKRFSHKDLTLG